MCISSIQLCAFRNKTVKRDEREVQMSELHVIKSWQADRHIKEDRERERETRGSRLQCWEINKHKARSYRGRGKKERERDAGAAW